MGLVDIENDNFFLFDATPDIQKQIRLLNDNFKKELKLEGIFLTHAHIGHYSGLMYFLIDIIKRIRACFLFFICIH